MLKYNMFAIKGISDFPITDKSPILIETFMVQNKLNRISGSKIVEDGKAGSGTFTALSNLVKYGKGWVKDLYPVPGQISKAAFDKIMTPSAYTSLPKTFGAAELFQCNKMLKDACLNLSLAITHFQQNKPQSSKIKSSDADRFMQDIQPFISKYNSYADKMNALYEGNGFIFTNAVMWTDKDPVLKTYALPLEGTLTMLKHGGSENRLVNGATSAGQKDFYPICLDIVEASYAVALFAQKYYAYSAPATSPSGKDTPTDNGVPVNPGPPITTNSDYMGQVKEIVDVFMSLLPIGMIFVGIKVASNIVRGVDKNTKF